MSLTTRTLRPGRARLAGLLMIPAALLVLSGCAAPVPTEGAPGQQSESAPADESLTPGENEVITLGLKFMPETITVPVGTTVTWRNGETIGHTITSGAWGDVNESTGIRGSQSADGLFDHALAPKGQEGDTFSFTFDEPGEYPYFCQPHLAMNAMVIVEG